MATISNYNFCLSSTKDCQKFCCFSAFILVQLYQQMPQKENCYLDLGFILGVSPLGEFSPSSPASNSNFCVPSPMSLPTALLPSLPLGGHPEHFWSLGLYSRVKNAHWKEAICRKYGSIQWISLLSRISLLKSGPQQQSDTFKQTSLLEYFICIFSCFGEKTDLL